MPANCHSQISEQSVQLGNGSEYSNAIEAKKGDHPSNDIDLIFLDVGNCPSSMVLIFLKSFGQPTTR